MWPSLRFIVSASTAEVGRVLHHIVQPFDSGDVVVCRNAFEPRPPKQLPKLGAAVRRVAAAICDEPNAGGSSDKSEAVSFAVLELLFGASLVATEMAVHYEWSHTKRIDYLAAIGGRKVGVSVTRAYKHRGTFDVHDARKLLCKKLRGLWKARRVVCSQHEWDLDVLHIWCATKRAADFIAAELARHRNDAIWPLRLFALAGMPPPVVMLTSTAYIDHVIFQNDNWIDLPPIARPNHATQFALSQRRALRERQARYAALVPHRYAPRATQPRLAYFMS